MRRWPTVCALVVAACRASVDDPARRTGDGGSFDATVRTDARVAGDAATQLDTGGTLDVGREADASPAADAAAEVRCDPAFEGLETAGGVKAMWPAPASIALPTVIGESIEWRHPRGMEPGVRITLVSDASRAPGNATSLYRRNEYAMHSPFSADGRYLVTHGISGRALFDGQTYQFIRIVAAPEGGRLDDWQWDPVRPGVAYYFNDRSNSVLRYDAASDTHRGIYTAGSLTMSVGGAVFTGLQLGSTNWSFPMAGEGSISADGRFLAFKLNDGLNGYVARLDVRTGDVTHALRVDNAAVNPQSDQPDGIDRVQIAPDGESVLFGLKGNGIYGTSFSQSNGNTQIRAYPLADFRVAPDDSSVLIQAESGHDDVGARSDGQIVYLDVNANATDIVSGAQVELLPREVWPRNSGGSPVRPAAHIGAADGAPYAILSSYVGGHAGTPNETVASDIPVFGFSLDTPGRVAWLGWTNVSPEHHPNASVPKAGFTTNAVYANGQRGWKWAFMSDNRTGGADSGRLYVGELVCSP